MEIFFNQTAVIDSRPAISNIKFFNKSHFHVKTNIQFFTALMPLEYGELF